LAVDLLEAPRVAGSGAIQGLLQRDGHRFGGSADGIVIGIGGFDTALDVRVGSDTLAHSSRSVEHATALREIFLLDPYPWAPDRRWTG
jgi:hypothetical protein